MRGKGSPPPHRNRQCKGGWFSASNVPHFRVWVVLDKTLLKNQPWTIMQFSPLPPPIESWEHFASHTTELRESFTPGALKTFPGPVICGCGFGTSIPVVPLLINQAPTPVGARAVSGGKLRPGQLKRRAPVHMASGAEQGRAPRWLECLPVSYRPDQPSDPTASF
ncbi:tetratricopeptide repeat protein 4 [Platysternon megacephalum]|uniref:Tetratricopeptide repeat protein 4 n=1 Tax=Platysternon megacephalum TaxID=55544 RepID=A0A4D9ETY1_9SAUR|nr:tetratricopeptide repeat protein 4 [Platysternon megacephalum]